MLGRYLQPDPAVANPKVLLAATRSGLVLPVYSYGANNPLAFADRSGLILAAGDWQANQLLEELSTNSQGAALIAYVDSSPIVFTVYGGGGITSAAHK